MSVVRALVDKLLTNVSQAYVPEGYISEMLLPELAVVQYTGKIGKYGNEHLRIVPDIMGGRGQARRVEIRQYSSDSYQLEEHGLEDLLTNMDYANVEEPFDAEKDVVMQLTTLLWLGKEKGLADALRDTAIITQNVTLAGTSQWSDYTNSDPIGDIVTGKNTVRAATGVVPDTLVTDWAVAEKLRYHPKILRNLGYADNRAGSLTNDELAKALGVRRYLVADVVYNSAVEGQADSLSALWGKDVILCKAPDKATKMQKSIGYRVQKAGESPRKVYKQNVINPPDAKSIIVKDTYDMVLTSTACAYLIKTAIA